MAEYHKLSTEKYVEAAAAVELKELEAQRRQENRTMMFQFGFALVVFAFSAAAVYSMPQWLPAVQQVLVVAGGN